MNQETSSGTIYQFARHFYKDNFSTSLVDSVSYLKMILLTQIRISFNPHYKTESSISAHISLWLRHTVHHTTYYYLVSCYLALSQICLSILIYNTLTVNICICSIYVYIMYMYFYVIYVNIYILYISIYICPIIYISNNICEYIYIYIYISK